MNGPHEPIDFVLPWVDDSDPAWRAEMNRWRRRDDDAQADDSPERYRDWGTLRYWFRAVERFAPWVNRIHLLTWGHLPEWLDEAHPRLHVVRHEEFIPDAYRPTFSSCPIELNMHRIEGLSERFVYFNDDTFLCRPVAPERFFRGGMPADMARLSIIPQERAGHNALECMRVINRRHAKRQAMAAAPGKWFSPRYPLADLLKSASLLPWSFFPGMKDHHMPQPFLKSTFNTLWEEEFDELDATCRHRFRMPTDLSQWLVRYEQLATGRFVPVGMRDTLLTKLSDEGTAAIADALLSGRYAMICTNDNNAIRHPEQVRTTLEAAFARLLPTPSRYERH